jgi:Na+/melibiose symporter-like transporter
MVAIFWYALWSCFIPLIAIAPQEWFNSFELTRVLFFLPDSWLGELHERFDGIPTGKFAFFIGVMCLKGSAIGALSALPYAMAADVIDLDSVQTGKRQGGVYFSIWTMTRKLAYALGVVVGTTTATIVGFNSLADPITAPNTWSSLLWLACLYSVVPALFKFVAIPILWKYPLTEEKLKEIQEEITAGAAPGA